MTYQNSIQKVRPELDKAIEFFRGETAKIRTGQASPALVEDLLIEAYDQKMPLKQLAAISCPERRQILIQPWDKTYLPAIEKALSQGSLGANPIADGTSLRITLPQLTQEFRQNYLKLLSEKSEEAKQVIRHWRDEAWGEIQELARKGEIREDDKFKGKEELQKVIDEYTKKVDEITARKETEIKET